MARKLTEEESESYLKGGGVHCPCCGSTNIAAEIENFAIDVGRGWQQTQCEDCHARWTDYYTLTGVELDKEPEDKV